MAVAPESGNGAVPGADHPEVTPAAESPVLNKLATIGFWLGIASVVVNPVLLVGLAAIVASALGWNRATLMGQHGYSAVGKAKAGWGIVLGLVATVVSVMFKGALF